MPSPEEWKLSGGSVAVNHIAMQLPDRASWLKQLEFLQSRGVKFNWRVNHGVTHSVYVNDPNGYGVEFLYELPREVWETISRARSIISKTCRPKDRKRWSTAPTRRALG